MRHPNPGRGLFAAWNITGGKNLQKKMKVARKNSKGETRELLLKEYFLNAYLIALLKKAGDEVARFTSVAPEANLKPIRVRSQN